jgi:SAM-dependent methyltransferase
LTSDTDGSDNKQFPHWDDIYNTNEEQIQRLPWYNKNLDVDLAEELNKRGIRKGRFLDVGTGPATQAIRLCETTDFEITATDLSKSAIERAIMQLQNNNNNRDCCRRIKFMVDDILNSKLQTATFDFIFDRGCFHVIAPSDRIRYIHQVRRILSDDGIFFLKTFSKSEPMQEGPYKFSPMDIHALFDQDFVVESFKETVYQGTLQILPRALFTVLKKRNRRTNDA